MASEFERSNKYWRLVAGLKLESYAVAVDPEGRQGNGDAASVQTGRASYGAMRVGDIYEQGLPIAISGKFLPRRMVLQGIASLLDGAYPSRNVQFRASAPSDPALSWADSTIITLAFRFSVHTGTI